MWFLSFVWLHFILTQILVYTIMESEFLFCPCLTLLKKHYALTRRNVTFSCFLLSLKSSRRLRLGAISTAGARLWAAGQQVDLKSSLSASFPAAPCRAFLLRGSLAALGAELLPQAGAATCTPARRAGALGDGCRFPAVSGFPRPRAAILGPHWIGFWNLM